MAVRVTGGTARGLHLRSPQGRGTRPTADRIRSALFSMLQAAPFEQACVLDLYAGTGALGIEALSRGAAWVDFVERDHSLCALMKENLTLAGFAACSKVYCGRVERFLGTLSTSYGLVFLDPPYADPGIPHVMDRLGAAEAPLAEDAIVFLEHTWRWTPATQYGRLHLWKQRRHGDTGIALYAVGGSNGDRPVSR